MRCARTALKPHPPQSSVKTSRKLVVLVPMPPTSGAKCLFCGSLPTRRGPRFPSSMPEPIPHPFNPQIGKGDSNATTLYFLRQDTLKSPPNSPLPSPFPTPSPDPSLLPGGILLQFPGEPFWVSDVFTRTPSTLVKLPPSVDVASSNEGEVGGGCREPGSRSKTRSKWTCWAECSPADKYLHSQTNTRRVLFFFKKKKSGTLLQTWYCLSYCLQICRL